MILNEYEVPTKVTGNLVLVSYLYKKKAVDVSSYIHSFFLYKYDTKTRFPVTLVGTSYSLRIIGLR